MDTIKVVCACIVHDKNRVWLWVWVHCIEKYRQILLEISTCPGPCYNVKMENAWKGNSWEDRITSEFILAPLLMEKNTYQIPWTKKSCCHALSPLRAQAVHHLHVCQLHADSLRKTRVSGGYISPTWAWYAVLAIVLASWLIQETWLHGRLKRIVWPCIS